MLYMALLYSKVYIIFRLLSFNASVYILYFTTVQIKNVNMLAFVLHIRTIFNALHITLYYIYLSLALYYNIWPTICIPFIV